MGKIYVMKISENLLGKTAKNEAKDGELQTITHTNGRTHGQTTHKR